MSETITASNITEIAGQAMATFEILEMELKAPDDRKQPPKFGTQSVAGFCGIDAGALRYTLKTKDGMPQGEVGENKVRSFDVAEASSISRLMRTEKMRPAGKDTFVLVVGHFKGGVGKTTTSASIAHGLNLKGHSVLVIDADPQGSISQLFGQSASTFDEAMTLAPFFSGEQEKLDYAITPSYWPGIDIIAGGAGLFLAEVDLPLRQMKLGSNYAFYAELDRGIKQLEGLYDFIIIDTPPSISYLTLNCYVAASGLLMPVPPSGLDFASSVQFWGLLARLLESIEQYADVVEWECIGILPSKVLRGDKNQSAVRNQTQVLGMMQSAYGKYVLPFSLPETKMADRAGTLLGSIYELAQFKDIDRRSVNLAIEAYGEVVNWVENHAISMWSRKHGA